MTLFVQVDDRSVAWKAVSVSRALDAFVGSAFVTLALDGPPPSVGARLQVISSRPGSAETLLIGYVDAVSASGNAQGGEVTLDGRDRTADLVDGTRLDADWTWAPPATLLDVARAIAAGWGIGVVDEAGAGALGVPYIRAEPEETAYAVLERAARLHGVLLSTTSDGRIRLGYPTRARAGVELRTGPAGNVTRWALRTDGSQRFHRVRMLSPGGLWDLVPGSAARSVGRAEDPAVRPQREAGILAPDDLRAAELDALARWTVSIARARSATLTVEVPSLTMGDGGRVWQPGTLVAVEIREAGLAGELLVVAVDLTSDEAGEVASLGLAWPAAFEVDPTEAIRLRRGSVEALVE